MLKPEQFPILRRYAPSRRWASFEAHLTQLDNARHVGQISNPVYLEMRQVMGVMADTAWDKHVTLRYDKALPPVFDFLGPLSGLHSAKSLEKAVNKAEQQWNAARPDLARSVSSGDLEKRQSLVRAYLTQAREVLGEALQLMQALDSIKDKVIKRTPRPAGAGSEVKDYVPPPSSTHATQAVKMMLEAITQSHRQALIDYLAHYYAQCINNHLQALAEGRAAGVSTPQMRPPLTPRIFSACCERKPDSGWAPRADMDAIVSALAAKDADEIQRAFVFKNLTKICAIIEEKGNLTGAKTIEGSIQMGSLQGVLQFAFADGSQFTVKNSAVRAYSVHGRPFTRYPITFHQVILPDGTTMKLPSEERMNTIFAVACGEPSSFFNNDSGI